MIVTLAGAALLVTAPAARAHDSHAWPTQACAPGETHDCWHTVPNAAAPMIDALAGSGDSSHDSNPQPRNGDLYSGPDGTLPTVYYAYDDNGTPEDANDDFVFFRMRLDGTPTLAVNGGSSPPYTAATGPFSSNTAWNFILDLNGDGWADFAASTDGNTGKQQDPDDTYRLTYINTPGNQLVVDESVCLQGGGGGQLLFLHKAIDRDLTNNDPGYLTDCLTQTAESCDFGFTRVVNEAPPVTPTTSNNDQNFFLDMQFPLAAFDDCHSVGTDDDTEVGTTLTNVSFVPGEQLLTPTTPFTLCVTTSTQPNDFTNKDIAYDGTFRMRSDQPLPCGEPCTLAGGCDPAPVLIDISEQCGAGTNSSPVTLTATIMDAGTVNGAGTVVDTIASVQFLVLQEGETTWTAATPAAGSTNPVVAPVAGTLNQWRLEWNTSAVSTSPTSVYLVRVVATDDLGHQHDSSPIKMTLSPNSSCGASNNPITLASFTARRGAEGTVFEWTTETEAGNAGFNLYAETGGGWRRINRELIPSHAVDSTAPLEYRYEARGTTGTRFAIEDVDVRGQEVFHGPFEADRLHGERPRPEAIDWDSVRGEHERAARGRATSLARRTGAGKAGGGAASGGGKAGDGSAAAGPSVDLLVDRDGIYRVSFEELAAAGFDLSAVPAASLAVTSGGQPVPVRVVAPGSQLGPGSYLELVGEALDTLYTTTNVYTLTVDPQLARRVAVDGAAPSAAPPVTTYRETVRIENDRRYSFASPSADPWYDTTLSTGRAARSWHFDLPVDGYVPGAGEAHLEVDVWGVTDSTRNPDHHVRAALNGVPVADVLFNGIAPQTLAAAVPEGILTEGVNRLTLELPGDTGTPNDLVSLDGYAVTYPRTLAARDGELAFNAGGAALRVAGLPEPGGPVYRLGADGPVLLAGARFEADGAGWAAVLPGTAAEARYVVASPAAVRAPGLRPTPDTSGLTTGRADYLVISHPDFLDSLGPLVAAREGGRLRVKVASSEAVYARFGHGRFDPQALAGYIAHAVAEMGTRYVLLVGADTYDYRDRLGLGSISFLPSLYAATGEIVRHAPTDALLADVDGDRVPDVPIGRFPVRTTAELDALVAKTLAYEAKPYERTAVFAADAFDLHGDDDYGRYSDDLIALLPRGWSAERAYIDRDGVAGAQQTLIAAIDEGVALTTYLGHSGQTAWSFRRLFDFGDIAALANHGRPTVVMQWGCWNTYYVDPTLNTMSHKLLLAPDRGAAASLGSSTLSDAESDRALGALLMPRLAARRTTLGEALTAAKQELALTRPDLLDVLLGFNLLGDPALVLEP